MLLLLNNAWNTDNIYSVHALLKTQTKETQSIGSKPTKAKPISTSRNLEPGEKT